MRLELRPRVEILAFMRVVFKVTRLEVSEEERVNREKKRVQV